MRALKLFFQLPNNALGWRAELELIKRFEIVCPRLGHQCFSSPSVRDAMEAGADIIFTLHFSSAKITPIFTVGFVWNPLYFLYNAGSDCFLKCLSLDGHFYGGQSLRDHFASFVPRGYRIDDLGDFYPSAPATEYVPVENFGLPSYVGSLWQEERHEAFFTLVNERRAIQGYGGGRRWARYDRIYQGSFALDGDGYREIYRRSGIGLCLHSQAHLEDDIPSMRIFEIIASGCVTISDDLPFVRREFGDSVFYLDHTQNPADVVGQLRDIVGRIHARPAQAREMARAAHEIFLRKFSLDRLLERGLNEISTHRETRRGKAVRRKEASPSIQIFTRTRGTRPWLIRRALRSLAAQNYPRLRGTLIYHGPNPEEFRAGEFSLLQSEFPCLGLEMIEVSPREPLSATIPAALRACQADFAGFLDDDDWIFDDHIETLVQALESDPRALIATSGAAAYREYQPNASTLVPHYVLGEDAAELISFEPLDFARLKKGEVVLCSHAMLLRNHLNVDWTRWPRAQIGEDRALLALIGEGGGHGVVFTSRVTCAWSNRQAQSDNQVDRAAEPGLVAGNPLVVYKPPVPTRLKAAGIFSSLHPWRAQAEKRQMMNRLLKARRWLPRPWRPIFYQQRFNAALISMVEDWVDSRFLAVPESVDFARLKRLCQANARPGPAQQEEIDRGVAKILGTRDIVIPKAGGRHTSNLALASAFERLSGRF